MYGKKIELFLVNGTFDGTVLAELSNWNGKAIKVLRDDKDIDRKDLCDIGIYFLFCGDETDGVYIGESENVQTRLKQHKQDYNKGKEEFFWTNALVFTGRDLNKAKIRYLENELINQANEANRYDVLTKASYGSTKLKESEVAEMNEFIENIKILVNTLGYKVFVKNTIDNNANVKQEIFKITQGEANARMIITSEGFVLLAGSVIRSKVAPTFPTYCAKAYRMRNELISKGIVNANFIVTKDIVFSSASGASDFVLGVSSNGKALWIAEDGKCLGEKEL